MNSYGRPIPLWVIYAEELPGGGIQIFASRDITKADLTAHEDPWMEPGRVRWNEDLYPWSEGIYQVVRPSLSIHMRHYVDLRGPDLRFVLEDLYRRWTPRPDGDVRHT